VRSTRSASGTACGCCRHSAAPSAATSEPGDLDVGVLFRAGSDLLGLLEDLVVLTGIERVDLADLGRAGPVMRECALVGAVALYEAEAGDYAQAQMAAMLERMDTEWLRRLDLELMAE